MNDNESGLIEDIDRWLEKLAPYQEDYQHHQTGEDNGDSHLKSMIVHHQVIVPVTNGKLDLGYTCSRTRHHYLPGGEEEERAGEGRYYRRSRKHRSRLNSSRPTN